MRCSEKQIRRRFVCALVLILVTAVLFSGTVKGAAAYMQAQSYICNTFIPADSVQVAGESEIEAQNSTEEEPALVVSEDCDTECANSEGSTDEDADAGMPADEDGSDKE